MSDESSSDSASSVRSFLRKATDPLYNLKRGIRHRSALLWRPRFGRTTFVAITGSHGKTTATALLGTMLATLAPTYVRKGQNTKKAAAKTVLRALPWYHRFAVQEAAVDRPQSMENIVAYLRPTVGVVTAISSDHRKAFGGSREAIAAEKAKLVHSLPAGGLAVLNADDPLVAAMSAECRCRVVTFGSAPSTDMRLLEASAKWPDRLTIDVAYRGEHLTVQTRLVGTHWAGAVMAALLTALELGADRAACLDAIKAVEPVFNRMSVHGAPSGAQYVLDANKSSYFGIEACLSFLDQASAPRKTVVIGTIADYPGASRPHYNKVARMALDKADRVFFTGANASRVQRLADGEFAGRLFVVERPRDVVEQVGNDAVRDEVIYVKAARIDRLAATFVSRRQR